MAAFVNTVNRYLLASENRTLERTHQLLPHASAENTCLIALTGSFQLHVMGDKWLLFLRIAKAALYSVVHANMLCVGCLGNKLPYHVLQLPPHLGQPIHLPNEMS